ncbi:hypothetical protein O6H91_Y526600 [Diphasiastrum complanatum]|nr:hypothetical protein O6H91_Y526600 [Diphasiastrum complanatum]
MRLLSRLHALVSVAIIIFYTIYKKVALSIDGDGENSISIPGLTCSVASSLLWIAADGGVASAGSWESVFGWIGACSSNFCEQIQRDSIMGGVTAAFFQGSAKMQGTLNHPCSACTFVKFTDLQVLRQCVVVHCKSPPFSRLKVMAMEVKFVYLLQVLSVGASLHHVRVYSSLLEK